MSVRPRHLNLSLMVKALIGFELKVELRNDVYIKGLLHDCDDCMNLVLSAVELTRLNGKTSRLDVLHVSGRQIRYIDIPDQVDLSKALDHQVNFEREIRNKNTRHKWTAKR